jgi:hypothetical protein
MAYFVTELSLRQGITPAAVLGRVNASFEQLGLATSPLGLLAGGALAQAVGPRLALGIGATGSALGLLRLAASPIRRLRTIPVAPAASAPPATRL